MPTQPRDFRDYLHIDGPDMRFTVQRAELAKAGEEHFTTFSMDMMISLADQIQGWITSRLIRHAEADGAPPVSLHVHVDMQTADRTNELDFDWAADWRPDGVRTKSGPYPPQAIVATADRIMNWIGSNLLRPHGTPLPQAMTVIVAVHADGGATADSGDAPDPGDQRD